MSVNQDGLRVSMTTGAGSDAFRVVEVWGREELSQPFEFQIVLESDDPAISLDEVVGKEATLEIEPSPSRKRTIHGWVTRARRGTSDARLTRYHLELRPWLWMARLASDCRIFQEMTTPEIVTEVLGDLGFSDLRQALKGTYEARSYCVQYRESAFDFVHRLLEDEGITYWFEHSAGKHEMVLCDDPSTHAPVASLPKVGYRRSGTGAEMHDQVTDCSLECRVVSEGFALDDFEFETPSAELYSKVGTGKLVQHDWPGGFAKTADGQSRAQLRLDAEQAEKETLSGASTAPAFTAGATFELEDHPSNNGTWILRAVTHHFDQHRYYNDFEALPENTRFRPAHRTPRPRIPGTQTATVTGKSGEEIWTDKYGRIKVRFHWDHAGPTDENSSCWVRVAHGWAGKQWGLFTLPRIGQEVVVSFLDGDPDRPLVTGSVYNAEQMSPYTLPADQTKSTLKSQTSKGGAGFNELRFEDLKDNEQVFLQAQKDLEVKVLNDQTATITKNRSTTIEEGNDTLDVAKGTRTVSVKQAETHTNDANYTHTVKGDFTLDVKGSITIKAGKDIIIQAGTTVLTKAGTTLTAQAGTTLTNKAGTSLTNQAGTTLTNKAGTSMTNEAGVSLTNKGSSSQTVDGGGMLTGKAGLIKLN
jgi:type VI secretion system secreted protein VgrG